MKQTTKKEVLERMGMVVQDDAHSNAQKLDSLYQRQRTPSQPPPPARVDRLDHASSPAALHDAYLAALKGRHDDE